MQYIPSPQLHMSTHTGYLAALGIVVDLVTRGQQDAVLCCGFLSARGTGVTIIYTIGNTPHGPHTQHLKGHDNISAVIIFRGLVHISLLCNITYC